MTLPCSHPVSELEAAEHGDRLNVDREQVRFRHGPDSRGEGPVTLLILWYCFFWLVQRVAVHPDEDGQDLDDLAWSRFRGESRAIFSRA